MTTIEPIVTQLIDKRITAGECSDCHEYLDLGNRVGSYEEQVQKLFAVFKKHLREKHQTTKMPTSN
jgi:hypothetical protein